MVAPEKRKQIIWGSINLTFLLKWHRKTLIKKTGKNQEEEKGGGDPHEAGIAPPERVSTRRWRSRIWPKPNPSSSTWVRILELRIGFPVSPCKYKYASNSSPFLSYSSAPPPPPPQLSLSFDLVFLFLTLPIPYVEKTTLFIDFSILCILQYPAALYSFLDYKRG